MRVRAQVAMVMNLDKCIGCHTCSVTCKQVWTNRPGTEYVWFNNVETKPGLGYPRRWADQAQWNGGWELDRKGRLRLRAGGKVKKLLQIFSNPDLPLIDDFYEPWTYDYETLVNAPLSDTDPVARSHSQLTGKPMQPTWGPNWDEGLAGGPADRDGGSAARRDAGTGAHDLRAGVHVLPAADLRALPEPVVRRVVSVGSDVQARGGRHRPRRSGSLPRVALLRVGCPYKKVYFNHATGKAEKCTLCYPRIEVGQPTICSETCVGRIRYLGLLLYDADRVEEAASVPDERDLLASQRSVFLDPEDPAVREAARRDGIPDDWLEHARRSPVYDLAVRWAVALPLHPEFRTLPMVWYVPPLSPVGRDAGDRRLRGGPRRRLRRDRPPADPAAVPGEPAERGRHRGDPRRAAPPGRHALLHAQARGDRARPTSELPGRVGYDRPELERMYRLLAIANYEDRYVIPQAHAEQGAS